MAYFYKARKQFTDENFDLFLSSFVKYLKRCMHYAGDCVNKIDSADIYLFSFEKMYFRNSSQAGLSVLVTKDINNKVIVDLVGFAGSQYTTIGAHGAHEDIAHHAIEFLKGYDFEIMRDKSDDKNSVFSVIDKISK